MTAVAGVNRSAAASTPASASRTTRQPSFIGPLPDPSIVLVDGRVRAGVAVAPSTLPVGVGVGLIVWVGSTLPVGVGVATGVPDVVRGDERSRRRTYVCRDRRFEAVPQPTFTGEAKRPSVDLHRARC